MKRIFKYQLKLTDEQELKLPKSASILSVINQNGVPTVYVLIDDEEKETFTWNFYIVGTGNPADHIDYHSSFKILHFLNTIQIDPFVWHIFYEFKQGGIIKFWL